MGRKFQLPSIPETTPKNIRFPNEIIQQVDEVIQGTNVTFSRFVIEATRVALENMKEDYVLYANVRGLRRRSILVRHILKNSLHTCIVAIGMSIPQLMAGTIVVENVFAWPGLGKLCINSIFNRDYPVIQTYVLLIGTLFVVFNLLFDIIQCIADPRLRREVS